MTEHTPHGETAVAETYLRVLALRLEGIADRIATVPVQIEDADAVRQAALIARAAVPFPKGVKVVASGDFDV